MKTATKISILVSIQIVLILSSFLVLAYFEAAKGLHGNLVNVSGKNRFLASAITNEVNHNLFHDPDETQLTSIVLLEDNLIFLKNGGIYQEIELSSLDPKYHEDWETLWIHYVELKTSVDKLPFKNSQSISIEDVERIEQLGNNLITDSDVLTKKISKDLETLSANLFMLEILLGSINIIVHVFMMLYIISIFQRESIEKLKKERFVSIGEFASNIAHDIKNPLTVIINSLQIIEKSFSLKPNEKEELIKKEISRIDLSVKRMDHQINDVLNYVKNVPMTTNINSLRKIMKNAQDTIVVSDNVLIELPTNDITIECDEHQLHVVFVNLLRNAIQAIGPNKGMIKVTISDIGMDKVRIDFRNSGPAISDDDLAHIFEPLFTTKMEGTGLGLTSCKNIIARHNGTINVNQEPVIFTIILPKKQAE